ncbi:hypothetical protein KR044_000885, partial [Drosophila immigrans]
PEVKGMVILKMDLSTKDKLDPSKNKNGEQNSAERRIAELNRVYKEFVSAWKKPASDAKRPNFSSKPIRLSALNELMNVVEHLRQPNTMADFVKAIDDEMSRETEGFAAGDKLLAKSNGNLRRMSRKMPAKEMQDVKTGGLYEHYKNKLSEILKAHKVPNKPLPKELSCTIGKELSPCHCDAKKTHTLAVDSPGNTQSQCHCDASKFALVADPAKLSNGALQCHCEEPKSASLTDTVQDEKSGKGDNDYFETLEACMQQQKQKKLPNGGPKPYFISNSKQRQMVWNDIPLVATQKAVNNTSKQLNAKSNKLPTKSKTEQTLNKNQKQLMHLLKVLQAKHQSSSKRSYKRGLAGIPGMETNQPNGLGFPQVLLNQPGQQQPSGNRMIDNMAKQLNVSPIEMAQRIASSSGSSQLYPPQSNSGKCSRISADSYQTIGYQAPSKITSEVQQQQPGTTANVAPMLEKILTRLQSMQDTNFNRGLEMWAADRLPCCFAEPADGAPCELTGSWESLLLGVRINIVDEHRTVSNAPKPICAQPHRVRRQCVKLTPSQIRERFKEGELKALNITVEETLPPRPHELIENTADWIFTGHAVTTLGGPVSFSCRKLGTKLMGTFIGFCRNCGCIDTIFGSWTFCQSSKDCQDVTMSIFERRDVLRRYSLPEMRKERIKDHLYVRSKFGKLEKEHQ